MNGSPSAATEGLNGMVKGAKGRKRKSKASRNGRVRVEHPSVLSDRGEGDCGADSEGDRGAGWTFC